MAKKVHINYNAIVFERYDETDVTASDVLKFIPDDVLMAVQEEGNVSIPVMIFIVSQFTYWMLTGIVDGSLLFECVNNRDMVDITIPIDDSDS